MKEALIAICSALTGGGAAGLLRQFILGRSERRAADTDTADQLLLMSAREVDRIEKKVEHLEKRIAVLETALDHERTARNAAEGERELWRGRALGLGFTPPA